MSEAELHVLRARLRGGVITKARRGELRCRLPVGLVYDSAGRVALDPDKQVQESVRLFFQTFDQTGAAHATIKAFRNQGLLFPTRVASGPRTDELVWGPLSLGHAASILHNPWYAGAYAFGRSRHRKQLDGKARRQPLPTGEWLALLRDAHPGYVSWQQYMDNQRRLQRLGEGTAVRSIAIEESYDVSANVFSSVDQRKKAPPMVALEPRTLELVRRHRRYLMQRNHPGIETGLLFAARTNKRGFGRSPGVPRGAAA